MATIKPLSDAQKHILNNAATHPDHFLFPVPIDLRVRGAIRQRVLMALIKQGLAAERPTADDTLLWRRDARGRRLTLAMTAAGCAAIGLPEIGSHASQVVQAVHAPVADREKSSLRTPGGKLGIVLSALAAEEGATLVTLATLTGWLPHTTRAALCRLRKRGYAIHVIGTTGSKAYRLDMPA